MKPVRLVRPTVGMQRAVLDDESRSHVVGWVGRVGWWVGSRNVLRVDGVGPMLPECRDPAASYSGVPRAASPAHQVGGQVVRSTTVSTVAGPSQIRPQADRHRMTPLRRRVVGRCFGLARTRLAHSGGATLDLCRSPVPCFGRPVGAVVRSYRHPRSPGRSVVRSPGPSPRRAHRPPVPAFPSIHQPRMWRTLAVVPRPTVSDDDPVQPESERALVDRARLDRSGRAG